MQRRVGGEHRWKAFYACLNQWSLQGIVQCIYLLQCTMPMHNTTNPEMNCTPNTNLYRDTRSPLLFPFFTNIRKMSTEDEKLFHVLSKIVIETGTIFEKRLTILQTIFGGFSIAFWSIFFVYYWCDRSEVRHGYRRKHDLFVMKFKNYISSQY